MGVVTVAGSAAAVLTAMQSQWAIKSVPAPARFSIAAAVAFSALVAVFESLRLRRQPKTE